MPTETIVLLLLLPCGLYACFSLYAVVRGIAATPNVPASCDPRDAWPKLSLIVPARNEEKTLEAATRAKLACDYPNLEVVIVEDRSTDETARVADALAERDARIRVDHVRELPAGWLGKVHALDRGVRTSTGEWLLFSDADVHLSPSLLRRIVAYAQREELEFMALVPHLEPAPALLELVYACFLRIITAFGRLWLVRDPKSRVSVGGGAFNLVRRSAYERSPGFEHLKMEVADDVGFGQMMKHAGARCAVLNAPEEVRVQFYSTLADMMLGLEKNGFALYGYSAVRAVLSIGLVAYLELAPAAALFAPWWSVRAAGVGALAVIALVSALTARWTKRGLGSSLVPAVGIALFMYINVRAVVLALWRGGVFWRGTFYALDELRRGKRLDLPL